MKRILITGSRGQVGWELMRTLQPLGQVEGVDRSDLDMSSPRAVRALLESKRPDVVVNSAGYTAVDRAESEEPAARAVNADAVAELASCAERLNSLLVHFSTDYVFSGDKVGAYFEDDVPAPLSAYGRTKLQGDQALQASAADWLCLRTSWVYAPRGRNFFRTVLRLAMEREEISVVSDQHGAPTSARMIAEATAHIVSAALREREERRFRAQLLNLTATGSTTWHGFAEAILQRAARTPLKEKLIAKRIRPISSEEYRTPARRPANSRLSCEAVHQRFGLRMPMWDGALDLCISELTGAAPPISR